MEKISYIGKGFYRLKVRSKILRQNLTVMPDIQVIGDRIIFPAWMRENVKRQILQPQRRRTRPDAQQLKLLMEI